MEGKKNQEELLQKSYELLRKIIIGINWILVIAASVFALINFLFVQTHAYLLCLLCLLCLSAVIGIVLNIIFKNTRRKGVELIGLLLIFFIPVLFFCYMNCFIFRTANNFYIVKNNGKVIIANFVIKAMPITCDEIFYLDKNFSLQKEIVLARDGDETIVGELSCDLQWKAVPAQIAKVDYNLSIGSTILVIKRYLTADLIKVYRDNFTFTSDVLKQMENSVFDLDSDAHYQFDEKILQKYSAGWDGKFTLKNIRVVK